MSLKELVDNQKNEESGIPMSGQNVSLSTVLSVQSAYENAAWINLSAVVWGIPLNFLILFIGLQNKGAHRGYQFTVLCMSFAQFYAALMETLLYSLYLLANRNRWQMTLLTCSLVRRFLQTTMTPANLSPLVLAVDRYLFILYNKKLRLRVVAAMFGFTFVYSHLIYFPLQIVFVNFGNSDICGPALAMPTFVGYFVQPIEPLCICIAFAVNLRIVLFISHQRTSKTMALRGIRKREFKEMQFAMFGLLIQSLVPFVFTMPQAVNLAAYNLDHSFRFSEVFWKVINFLVYFGLSINAICSLLFVRQFRIVVLDWFRRRTSAVVLSGGAAEVGRTAVHSSTSIKPAHHFAANITIFTIVRHKFRHSIRVQ